MQDKRYSQTLNQQFGMMSVSFCLVQGSVMRFSTETSSALKHNGPKSISHVLMPIMGLASTLLQRWFRPPGELALSSMEELLSVRDSSVATDWQELKSTQLTGAMPQ